MRSKLYFLIFFLVIFLLLSFFTVSPFYIKSLFILNFLVLYAFTIYYLFKDKKYSPIIAAFIVFNFLFFIIAPMVQIHDVYVTEDLNLVNKLIYEESLIVKTNLFILVFNIVLFLFYRFFNAIPRKIKIYYSSKNLAFHIIALFVLSVIIYVMNFGYIKNEYLEHGYLALTNTTKATLLIKEKIILMMPFPAFILGVYYLKQKEKRRNFLIVFLITGILLLLILLIKNPLTEKRNALGPLYITIVFLIFPKLLNTNFKALIFLFFSMVIIFPTISLITHAGYSLDKLIKKPDLIMYQIRNHGITNTFKTLNYDAFFNFSATIEHVEKDGLSYGNQLSGALFFFVPRKVWKEKPISSGEFVGEYLKNNYGDSKDFTNLSNPYVSEALLNFGLLGVILFAIVLAFFMSLMVKWLNGLDPLKIAAAFYTSIHFIFFLRGDFTNAYSFLLASFVVILVIPRILFMFFHKTKLNWKGDDPN